MSQRKLGTKYAIFLLACAALFDALSLIPGLNSFVAIVGQFVMACLFYVGGVNVFKSRPAVMYVLSTLLEAIPASSALPFFLAETAAIIGLVRAGKA